MQIETKHINPDISSKIDCLGVGDDNNIPRKLTIEQLRKHKEYQHVSNEEAEYMIDTLHKLSILAYLYYVDLDNNK